MMIYSIILGRNSKKSIVDVYLASLGGGMNISLIFYDFQRCRFALKVVGKNRCFVEGVLHLPTSLEVLCPPHPSLSSTPSVVRYIYPLHGLRCLHRCITLPRRGGGRISSDYLDDDEEDTNNTIVASASKKLQREWHEMFGYGGLRGKTGSSGQLEKKSETRSRATVLSDLCGPREWMPMAKLHFEIVEQYGNVWHQRTGLSMNPRENHG
ncbi:PREDICTED: FHA domain-containing protein FHA2-like [Nelumbo nucifera]|uniref:FHA domain-containing protein FHA2-like n=1 Tax=Nelumbo nucifera TaxID=4432 RepID=A0A1U8AK69_NELNU|nr:PREDICTED: FHA domain-containing protein FHA2-like [Nelumbo nucifera]